MKIFAKTGKMALGSRLRLLTAKVTEDAAQIYEMYQVEFSPKWFPVFFILSEDGEKTITEIAVEIGHSQPSVTKIIQEMKFVGLVQENLNSTDRRRNVVALSEKGNMIAKEINVLCTDVDKAIESVIAEATHNLWEAIEEWEFLLDQKSLFRRVQEQKNNVRVKMYRLLNILHNINLLLNHLMKNGFLLILRWRNPITRHWIIQKNIF